VPQETARERSLQTTVYELEAERKERDGELNALQEKLQEAEEGMAMYKHSADLTRARSEEGQRWEVEAQYQLGAKQREIERLQQVLGQAPQQVKPYWGSCQAVQQGQPHQQVVRMA